MIPLPPTEFTYGKYNADIPFDIYAGEFSLFAKWLLTQNIIGYCKSEECEIRPRPEEMAVMFEKDEWQSWSHVPNDVWKLYLKQLKSRDKK